VREERREGVKQIKIQREREERTRKGER